jgi:hypothetical protein
MANFIVLYYGFNGQGTKVNAVAGIFTHVNALNCVTTQML